MEVRPVDHLYFCEDWKLTDARVLEKVEKTCFYKITNMVGLEHDCGLLSALVSIFDEDKNCFRIGHPEAYVNLVYGLEDVLFITGLPVDGKPVTGVEKNSRTLCDNLLGRSDFLHGGSVVLTLLKNAFHVIPEDASEDIIDKATRAYLLFIIGKVVLPDISGYKVPAHFLDLLEDFDEVNSYAWGAACLAHTYDALARCKKETMSKERKLACSCFFLSVFFYEHIPSLRPIIVKDLDYCFDFPLIIDWSKLLCEPSKNNHNRQGADFYITVLQDAGVDWNPYSRFSEDFLPLELQPQRRLGMSRTVVICYEKTKWHRPDKCPEKFNIGRVEVPDVEVLPPLGSRAGPKSNKDWKKKAEKAVQLWDSRWRLCIDAFTVISTPDVSTPVSPISPSSLSELTGHISQLNSPNIMEEERESPPSALHESPLLGRGKRKKKVNQHYASVSLVKKLIHPKMGDNA